MMRGGLPTSPASAPVPDAAQRAVATLLTASQSTHWLFDNMVCNGDVLERAGDRSVSGRKHSGIMLLISNLHRGGSPGRIRPGLIEARPPPAWPASSEDTLPGGFARASLKRFRAPRHRRDRACSPGRIRPGLIEAVPTTQRLAPNVTDSPGRIRPGLIEACRSRRGCTSRRPRSPGRIRPGLIEAIARRGANIPSGILSRADSPGPH